MPCQGGFFPGSGSRGPSRSNGLRFSSRGGLFSGSGSSRSNDRVAGAAGVIGGAGAGAGVAGVGAGAVIIRVVGTAALVTEGEAIDWPCR
ncbi:hypothetical protein BOTCAL_0182g00120 [Botryotinia calthae]|uniref:Uncharacterized protein n=1 Tax=Botryotinia calthae TaxID=38488 RepID=A0A4Y8D0I9_9HELO|nr:hypothetical protein BOTCAL_0182g00120 [Botryotinia calthae]